MADQQFRLVDAARNSEAPVALDEVQQQVVDHRGGALLVVGGPGTGKTTTLVESVAARASVTGALDDQLVLTWSRPAAQSLRSRLVRRLGRTQLAPKVMTVHGFCHALVRRFAADDPDSPLPAHVRLLTAPEQEFRVRELLAGHDTSEWPDDLQAALPTRAFAAEVRNVLARTRQLGMDPIEVVEAGRSAHRPEWQAIGEFFDEYLDVLDAEGVLDYAELVHRCRLLMLDEQVRGALTREISCVHVDEFSEADPSQVGLLADLAGQGIDLVAFADPTTAAFGFRGADSRGVLDFVHRFSSTGRPARRIDLVVNHRNAHDISRACTVIEARLPRNGAGLPARARDDAPRGRVQALVFESAGAQVEHVAEVLRTAHLEQGLDWSQMAVLTRAGRRELPGITRALAAAGLPVEVAGDEIALAEELAVRPLLWGLQAALVLTSDDETDGVATLEPDLVARLLRSPLGGLDSLALRRLGRRLRQTTDDGRSSAELVAELVTRPHEPADGPASPEFERAVELGRLLDRVAGRVARGATAQAVLWELWDGTSWPDRLRAEALRGGPGAQRAHRDGDAVMALFDLAARDCELVGEKGVRALLAEVAGQQIPADTARESDLRHRGVRLVTAHRAKGEQWQLVVVLGVQEGAWPNLARRGTLLEPDRLSPSGVLPPSPIGEVLADERRLFHLACSRAVETLVVTAVQGVEGEGDEPSRFLEELGVDVTHVPGRATRPMTLTALVAELRRVATNAAQPPDFRQAAAARLARLADATDHDGRPLVPSADPHSWWGVLDHSVAELPLSDPNAPIVLQSSQVQGLLECPRQWFLSRQARAEGNRSSAANLGTVVHLLAQHALSEGIEPDDLVGHLDEVWGEMSFDAAWLGASERVEAEAAIERFAAWTDAMDSREVLGVEVDFRTSIDVGGEEVIVVGSIDRLERDAEGRLRVVDFKTGRSTPTSKQVQSMEQIGIYQLVCREGAFDRLAPGERRLGGAELVYLRKQDGQQPWPKVLSQASLDEVPKLPHEGSDPSGGGADQDDDQPTWVHERLARAARIVRDEKFPAQACDRCQFCAFAIGCPARSTAQEVVE